VIGQDRDRDRRRREELRGRKLSPTGLTELEKAEFLKLEALFRDEDRDAKEGRPSSSPSVLPAGLFKRVRPRRQEKYYTA
jgi:hypothetical protein